MCDSVVFVYAKNNLVRTPVYVFLVNTHHTYIALLIIGDIVILIDDLLIDRMCQT